MLSILMRAAPDPLSRYRSKRKFGHTPEPEGVIGDAGDSLSFVIQKHAASRLHYDFRLELDGVMLSWAVPKGPSYDPKEKRMAVRVEDHPISYNSFEGTIPRGQYGAGTVIIWDRGTWTAHADPKSGLTAGKLVFTLHGQKMAGMWELVRIGKPDDRQVAWLLFKKKDAYARPKQEYDIVTALPDSVITKPLGQATREATAAGVSSRAAVAKTVPATKNDAAVKAPLPEKLGPQLATLSAGLPPAGEWSFEIKFDGYRIMSRIEKGIPRLITRGGHDWSSKMPALVREIKTLGIQSAWLDGEIVVMGANGTPSFNALQNAFDRASSQDIVYFVFDLPFFDGFDLRQVPLRDRRELLKSLLDNSQSDQVRYSADFQADPASILQSARNMNLEGLIAKRGDAPYVCARTETWLKLKCRRRQEFVIGGFTDRNADRKASEIGSLLLGVYDSERNLVSVGSVGTGWDTKTATDLKAKLVALQAKASPFSSPAKKGRWSRRAAGSERWVAPELVAEIDFAEWTEDAQIRHATFQGLRVDKAAAEVVREDAFMAAGVVPLASAMHVSTTKITNPQRVIDASTGLTKLDLVRYYESVASWMLPHLKGRPCSLVRGPDGIGGELFFQKHAEKLRIQDVKDLDPQLWPGHEPLLEVATGKAISACAQMNVIEFHTWNALVKAIGKPDRLIFDIDPGEKVAWQQVQESAQLVRSLLTELGLESWLKTSGGKGLHLVVPVTPRYGWATVKGFSQAVVEHLARVIPARFVAKSGPSNRVGKIFVDFLRNGHGATTAAAYSARARPGLGVSMPVSWDQLNILKGGAHWTISTAREHLSFQHEDPWAGYWKAKQGLTSAMKDLGFKPLPLAKD